jgi:hypothetical protein
MFMGPVGRESGPLLGRDQHIEADSAAMSSLTTHAEARFDHGF